MQQPFGVHRPEGAGELESRDTMSRPVKPGNFLSCKLC
jgi:hypothetical protein